MITSSSNIKVKNIIQLRTKSKSRRDADAFVIEGVRMISEIPSDMIVEAFMTQAFYEKYRGAAFLAGIKYELVSEQVFAKMSDTVTPQGIIAIVKMRHYTLQDILSDGKSLYLMLEDIQDPGNLGTLIRTAEAAGVKGVIMSKGTVDIYNPKVTRSTMGAIMRVPFVYVPDITETIRDMKKDGIKVYAAALGDDTEYTDVKYDGGTAVLIGNEGNGLSRLAIGSSSRTIKIPMSGEIESLNAAVSAAIILYEARRQRNV